MAHYLDKSTEPRIREVAERELIAKHMRTIAEMEHSGVVAMIEDGKLADLGRAYELFKRINTPTVGAGLAVIKEIMAAHVKSQGMQLVQDDERNSDPVQYVQGLLALRDKYEAVISTAFAGDKQFYNALNAAFESFVNTNQRLARVHISLCRRAVAQGDERHIRGRSGGSAGQGGDALSVLARQGRVRKVLQAASREAAARRAFCLR